MSENKQELALAERGEVPNAIEKVSANTEALNGNHALVKTKDLPIAGMVSNEQLIAEERDLIESEDVVQKRYEGLRGWLRLGKVSRIIGMLSLYLYLDQYEDVHRKQNLKTQEYRLQNARKLSRFAVLGEKFYGVKLWFFHTFIRILTRIFIGSELNKEHNQEKQALWLKESIIALGPTFIKLGQSMGTRADLLPLPFVKELGTLVDDVPPFPNEVAFARIEKELGMKINEFYDEFEIKPVAAASLGQVYRAKLKSGEEVAVKVQRPNLESVIKGDVEILKKVAKFTERFPKLNENADWAGMLREFDITIHEEMDYSAEGRNAERFTESFKSWTNIHVPKIYWEATTSKVMTMDFIHGTKVTDLDGLGAQKISPEKVNRLLIRNARRTARVFRFWNGWANHAKTPVADDRCLFPRCCERPGWHRTGFN